MPSLIGAPVSDAGLLDRQVPHCLADRLIARSALQKQDGAPLLSAGQRIPCNTVATHQRQAGTSTVVVLGGIARRS